MTTTNPVALRVHALSWQDNNFNEQAREEKTNITCADFN
jgi:hypothetical protein